MDTNTGHHVNIIKPGAYAAADKTHQYFTVFVMYSTLVTHSSLPLSQGYTVRITGGNDKQGFPMKQGVLTAGRVKLLLSKGHSCYRPRRKGQRRRKSVHGCIVDGSLSVLSLVIVKKGLQVCVCMGVFHGGWFLHVVSPPCVQDIPGLTTEAVPRRLGPKRVGKIRKLYNLSKVHQGDRGWWGVGMC